MATFHGKDGKVRWDDDGTPVDLYNVTSWTATISVDLSESSAMDTANDYKDYLAGFSDWTATATTFLKTTGPDIPLTTGGTEAVGEKTPAYLELWFDQTGGAGNVMILHGTAICTGYDVTNPVDGIPEITYNFQGVGILAYVTTEP